VTLRAFYGFERIFLYQNRPIVRLSDIEQLREAEKWITFSE